MARITEEQTIWFPGIYGGRADSDYTQMALDIPFDMLVELVQKRANEDGEWAISNGFVGNNEDKMRKMMAFVADPEMIQQVVDHLKKIGAKETVDWVCRDLANASKWGHGSKAE